MKAMILGAGLGTRMAPISRRHAKPSLPVLDESLILRMVRDLARQGVTEVIVNEHARATQLRRALESAPIPVRHLRESTLRGSGGGIRGARGLLEGSDPFVVLNADMVIDLDLEALRRAHEAAGTLATLALRAETGRQEYPTIGYGHGTLVRRITDRIDLGDEEDCGLFAGVHMLAQGIFEHMPDRLAFDSMPHVYTPMLRKGEPIAAWLHPVDAVWWPVGTPRELLDANLLALDRAVASDPDAILAAASALIEGTVQGPAWIGEGARISAGAEVGPGSVIGAGARIASGTRVGHSLLLPGARPPQVDRLHRVIAHDEEIWWDD